MGFMPSLSTPSMRRKWQVVSRTARIGRDLISSRYEESRLPVGFRPNADDAFVAAAYFSSDVHSMYQLEQWLWPFEQLRDSLVRQGAGDAPFGILTRDARVAKHIASRTDLPVRFSRLTAGLEAFFSPPSLRAVFYVNQATTNFQALRFPAPAHVHLSHGESEKISMISNQLKAYDYVFTAGQAARDRITSTLHRIDSEALIDVGRPQLDRAFSVPEAWQRFAAEAPAGLTVLYAPTWEGDSPSMSYGTMATTGVQVVSELLDAGYRVILRTHPRTGLLRSEFARALESVRGRVDAHPRGFVDTSSDVSWQLDVADVAVAEMSSVAFDWLSTEKPLVMIAPTDPRAEVLPNGLIDRAVNWASGGGVPLVDRLAEATDRDSRTLSAHYLGDTSPGTQIERFIGATRQVIESRRDVLGIG